MGLTIRPLGHRRFNEERMNGQGQNAGKGEGVEVICRLPCCGFPAMKLPSILQRLIRHRRKCFDQESFWQAS